MVDERIIPEGYRVTEVGVIPEDWDIKKVGDIAFVSSGGTPNTKMIEYWNGKIRWMNSGELNLKRVYEVEGRITELGLNNSSTKIIPKNSILIGLAGQGKTRGTAAINYVDLCINQSIAAIYPSHFYDSEFLYQNINSRYDELRSMSTGDGGRGGLNLKIIRELQIHLPTLSEQKAIAEVLFDTDNLIQSLEKLIDKKKKIKHGTMQQLLTGKKRLPGFGGEWEHRNVESFGEIITGGTPPTGVKAYWNGSIPWVTPTDITSTKNIYTTDRKITNTGLSKLRKLPKNSVLITCIASIGKNAVIKKDGACNQQINAIIPSNGYDSEFLYYLFESNKSYLLSNAGITATNIISKKDFALIEFLVPKLDEQKAIAQVLSDMDLEIEALEEKLKKYKTIKQGMMQELLTGRIRLI